jgi:hypothetical protein
MNDLGPALVGAVLGLAMVGAVLLRNEEEIREAWRRRRAGIEPKAGPGGRWIVVGFGLIASANIGLAVADGGAFRIILAAGWLLLLCHSLLKYRRSHSLVT